MLFRSLLKLRLINNTKVDHPSKGEKDKADALAGAVFMCITNLGMEQDLEIEIWGRDSIEDEAYDGDEVIEKILQRPPNQAVDERKIPEDLERWLIEMI